MTWAEIPDDAKLMLWAAWWALVIAASAWRAVQARRARRWMVRERGERGREQPSTQRPRR